MLAPRGSCPSLMDECEFNLSYAVSRKKAATHASYNAFSMLRPFIPAHQSFTQWCLRSPLSVEVHRTAPSALIVAVNLDRSWYFRKFHAVFCKPAIASHFASKMSSRRSDFASVSSSWIPFSVQNVADTQSAKATPHSARTSRPPCVNKPARRIGRTYQKGPQCVSGADKRACKTRMPRLARCNG